MKRNVQLLALLLCLLMAFCSCDVVSYLPFGEGTAKTEKSTEATEITETTMATEDSAESSASATTEKTPESSEPAAKVKIAKIYTGKNSATHTALGVNFPWNMKFVLTSRLDLAWLESRSDYQDAGFVFSEMLGYTVPGAISDLLNNTVN